MCYCYVLCLDGGGGLLILNEKCQQNSPHYSVTSTRHRERGMQCFIQGEAITLYCRICIVSLKCKMTLGTAALFGITLCMLCVVVNTFIGCQ